MSHEALGPQFESHKRGRIFRQGWSGGESWEVPPEFDVLKEGMEEVPISVPGYSGRIEDRFGGQHSIHARMETPSIAATHPDPARQKLFHVGYQYFGKGQMNPAFEGSREFDDSGSTGLRGEPLTTPYSAFKTIYHGNDPRKAAEAAIRGMGHLHRWKREGG